MCLTLRGGDKNIIVKPRRESHRKTLAVANWKQNAVSTTMLTYFIPNGLRRPVEKIE